RHAGARGRAHRRVAAVLPAPLERRPRRPEPAPGTRQRVLKPPPAHARARTWRGAVAKARRKARANWLAEPNPAATATSRIGSDVSRMSWRARARRSAR